VAALLLTAAAAPALVRNESRALLAARNVLNTPRPVQYFANWTDIAGAYLNVARLIDAADCRDVALVSWWNGYEYPLWALAAGRGRPVKLHHVAVENRSQRYRDTKQRPEEACALVALARHETAAAYADSLGMKRVLDDAGIVLFLALPDGGAAEP
jgi:hypothetical protein